MEFKIDRRQIGFLITLCDVKHFCYVQTLYTFRSMQPADSNHNPIPGAWLVFSKEGVELLVVKVVLVCTDGTGVIFTWLLLNYFHENFPTLIICRHLYADVPPLGFASFLCWVRDRIFALIHLDALWCFTMMQVTQQEFLVTSYMITRVYYKMRLSSILVM